MNHFLNFYFSSSGILFWTFLRLLNNIVLNRRSEKSKQIEFNLPSHMKRRPMILQYVQIFVDFYILFLSAPLRRFPRANSERFYIATVCLLSLNIVSMFQSSLATVFIKPMYYKNIESLQQFEEANLKILIKYPAMMTDLFPEDSSNLFRTLHSRMNLVTSTELSALDIIDMGMSSVTRKATLKLSKEDTLVHLVQECPKIYNLAYLLLKDSAFLETVNSIILDIVQFGFINKWIDDAYFMVKLENIKLEPPLNLRARVLTINDMQLALLILVVGIGASLVILIIEIFLKRFH